MTLKRSQQPMPEFVREALREGKLTDAYDARPPYQRNDYLMWINKAAKDKTKENRLKNMLHELIQGHGYMGMEWKSK